MTPRARRLLLLIIGAGTIGRVVLAFATVGHEFDIDSYRLVANALLDAPLDLYTTLGPIQLGGFEVSRWPYPSGIFPWALATHGIENSTPLPFDGVIQLLPIATDAALAWLVQLYLGRKGAGEGTRLAAAALVAFGPVFFIVSGYHGQIDSVAFLPAVAALVLWDTGRQDRRALYAGLLIGLGGSVKTVPLFMVLPLLPHARSWREGATLLGSAAGVWLVAMAPWLLSDFDMVRKAMEYTGAPGLGGVTVLLQPDLAIGNLTQDFDGVTIGEAVRSLHDHTRLLVLGALGAVGAVAFRFRPPPVHAAVFMWLAVYAVSPSFFFQYAVWGLPFFIMAGYLVQAAVLQLALAVPMLIFYRLPWESDRVPDIYVVFMGCVWIAFVVALFLQARRIFAGRDGLRRPRLAG